MVMIRDDYSDDVCYDEELDGNKAHEDQRSNIYHFYPSLGHI